MISIELKVISHIILFWLFTIGSQTIANGQILHGIDFKDGNYKVQEEVDRLLQTTKDHELYEEIAHDFSVQYFRIDDYENAIKYALVEVRSLERNNVTGKRYTIALFQLAYFYEYNAQLDQAIAFFKKAIDNDPTSMRAIKSYNHLGDCYFEYGNYFQAEIYYSKAIQELKNHNDDDDELLAYYHLNLSKVYSTIDTPDSKDKELNVLNEALAIHDKNPLSDRMLSILYNNLANYNNSDSNYNFAKAKSNYQKFIENSIKISDSSIIGTGYINMGNLYIKEKRDSSRYYLEKGLEYPLSVIDKSKIFRNITNYEIQNNNSDQALIYLNKAIKLQLTDHNVNLDKPSLNLFKETENPVEIIFCLSKKADVLLKKYNTSKDEQFITVAFKNLQTADSLIDHIKSSNREENSRLYWRKEASEMYHKAVYCAYLLDNKELAFVYSEKNKAILLTENITANNMDLPPIIKNTRRLLNLKLIEYENKLNNDTDSTAYQYYSKAILNQKLKIKNYNDSIALAYPALFNEVTKDQILSLKEVQKGLKSDDLIISYIWNTGVSYKDHLMSLVISHDNVQVFEINDAQALKTDITSLNKLLLKPFETSSEKQAYIDLSNIIYNNVFPTDHLKKQLNQKKVTIIADGLLQNLPFDALITDTDKRTYLIEKAQISYAYSLSFTKSNKALKRNTKYDLICFSPTNFENIGLPKLYNTNKEANSITNYINGDLLLNNQATKEAFKTRTKDYKIIHLATHATSGDNAYIAFYDYKLGIKELYTLSNNAQLVFLSACDTSIGEIAEGEGSLTLARGFFNTGAQTVVASLWKTSDKSTSYIVEEFYKHISNGKGAATSLHLAKIDYIKNHNLSEVSPFYWSSLISIGDDHRIILENNARQKWLLYIAIFFILIVIILGIRKFLQK